MSTTPLHMLIAHCRAWSRRCPQVSDTELLRRFTQQRDDATFEELLERYAPLVWSVCQRMLSTEADREDAFQATFLAMIHKPHAIDPARPLGAWLHTVAVRVARKTLLRSRRQHSGAALPERATPDNVADDVSSRELCRIVDEEIERLSSALRIPIILCCLQGRTRDEAAELLGCSVAAVRGRLERGRAALKKRLASRGISLPTAFLVLSLTGERIRASLWAKTMQSALRSSSPAVAALAEAGLRTLAVGKWKLMGWGLATLVLMMGAVSAISQTRRAKSLETPVSPQVKTPATPKQAEPPRGRVDRHDDPLPPGAIARLGTVRFRHGYGVRSLMFSPDGKRIAAGGTGRTISLWDAASGKEVHPFMNPFQSACVAFSPDGNMLASPGYPDSLVVLWDANTGKLLRTLRGQTATYCVAFSPDGKLLASGSLRGTVFLWDAATGKEVRRVAGPKGSVLAVAFAPDGKSLAFAGKDGKIRFWNIDAGAIARVLDGHFKGTATLAFSPDGKLLASGGIDTAIRLWEPETGKQVRVLDARVDRVSSVIFSPDGRLLASAQNDGSLALWNPATGQSVRRWHAHASPPHTVVFSPNGNVLASGGAWESDIRFWETASGKELHASDAPHGPVELLRWSSDGQSLISAGRERRILWWDLATCTPRRQFRSLTPDWTAFALAPDGKTLATACLSDEKIRLYDVASGKKTRLLGKQEVSFRAIALSPDGRLLATGGRSLIRLWDMAAGKEIRRFKDAGHNVDCLTFSPDGKTLAYSRDAEGNTATDNKTIRMMDVATGKEIRTLAGRSWVSTVVFSPDGKVLASWHDTGTERFVCVWDTEIGKELCHRGQQAGGGGAIAFSPNGKLVASGGGINGTNDNSVHLWEAATGRLIRRFEGHYNGISSLAFAPDGLKLASGGGDATILLWDILGARRKTPPIPREMEACWNDLVNDDASKAYDAVWMLVAASKQAVPFLAKHLHPVPSPDAKSVARLLADLDSEQFPVRQKATKELGEFGDAIAADLRRALDGKLSLEMRRRVQQLLDRSRQWSPERLRVHRAIQALEHLGSPEAREVLKSLAAGAPGARQTEEAKAALRQR